jgi:hypothetical protein
VAIDWNLSSTFWTAIAARYKNNTNVIYELHNEPNAGLSNADFASHMQTLYQQVRAAAPNTPILAWSCAGGPCAYTDTLALAPQIDYTNAAIAFHGYAGACCGVYDDYVSQMRAAGYPVVMGEVVDVIAGAYTAGFPLVLDMEAKGVSWFWMDYFGFCDADNGKAYGVCATYEPVTWPED